MPRSFTVQIKHYHLTLTRWADQDTISVTLSPSGYVIDAHSEKSGFDVDLTDDELRYILEQLKIDED
jgi:hypothetical protein